MLIIKRIFLGCLFIPALAAGSEASSSAINSAERYQHRPPVVPQLTQVVYYREDNDNTAQGAYIYIDGEFHTRLLPGGFTQFCLRPGTHTLSDYFHNNAAYEGKRHLLFEADFRGGQRYFLQATPDSEMPVAVRQQKGEQDSGNKRQQRHLLSRASAVVPCVYQDEEALKTRYVTLNLRDLFYYDSNWKNEITTAGREALREMLIAIRRDNMQIHRLTLLNYSAGQAIKERAAVERTQVASLKRALIDSAFAEDIIYIEHKRGNNNQRSDCVADKALDGRCAAHRKIVLQIN
ncbi:hypothetical protein J9874_00427 [Duffyella gerundensis]|uniref:DUF2846 domain-containing protein n=1 Tax=Duffyella gerundensis TaxID=1619313 RepID=UPI001CE2679A|nr:DUF2846 domain-containing protein [Duffyella gerundensis]UCB29923.1 hypothetical protein J9874_00427 [Duffyella gerundensis]